MFARPYKTSTTPVKKSVVSPLVARSLTPTGTSPPLSSNKQKALAAASTALRQNNNSQNAVSRLQAISVLFNRWRRRCRLRVASRKSISSGKKNNVIIQLPSVNVRNTIESYWLKRWYRKIRKLKTIRSWSLVLKQTRNWRRYLFVVNYFHKWMKHIKTRARRDRRLKELVQREDRRFKRKSMRKALIFWRTVAAISRRKKRIAFDILKYRFRLQHMTRIVVAFKLLDAFSRFKRRSRWVLVVPHFSKHIYNRLEPLAMWRQWTKRNKLLRSHSVNGSIVFGHRKSNAFFAFWNAHRLVSQKVGAANKLGTQIGRAKVLKMTMNELHRNALLLTSLTSMYKISDKARRKRLLQTSLLMWKRLSYERMLQQRQEAKATLDLNLARKTLFLSLVCRQVAEKRTLAHFSLQYAQRRPKERDAVLRLRRFCVKRVKYSAAVAIGSSIWLRKMFSVFHMIGDRRRARNRENHLLQNFFSSRHLPKSLTFWRRWNRRRVESRNIVFFCRASRALRKWKLSWRTIKMKQLADERSHLRRRVRACQKVLLRLYVHAQKRKRLRFSFNVFRRLVPIPCCSPVRKIFVSWRDEFVRYRKNIRKAHRAVVSKRKGARKAHYFEIFEFLFRVREAKNNKMRYVLQRLWWLVLQRRSKFDRVIRQRFVKKIKKRHTFKSTKICAVLSFGIEDGTLSFPLFFSRCFLFKYLVNWRKHTIISRNETWQLHSVFKQGAKQAAGVSTLHSKYLLKLCLAHWRKPIEDRKRDNAAQLVLSARRKEVTSSANKASDEQQKIQHDIFMSGVGREISVEESALVQRRTPYSAQHERRKALRNKENNMTHHY